MSSTRSAAASVRDQKLARVIDREVAPIWHDRFARILLREVHASDGTFALDVHSGPGHTTAELLQRLGESARIVALGRDPWLMQISKARVRPEWKRRVYFKSGDFDDVTGMGDDTYDLSVANLVLGEQVVDWQAALGELMRVTKPGGQVFATLPLHGTWQEVEDLFEELLRDEGMKREVATLRKLRQRRPKPAQLAAGLQQQAKLGAQDYIVEHERFEMLFRSGREFLFAPVIEHGPLRLWKAIIGRAEKPQALFWRFKEAIDTYYAGHVLGVTVVAGLIRLRVPGGEARAEPYAAKYWARYPQLSRVWAGEIEEPEDEEFDLDLDIDMDIDMDVDEGDEDQDDDEFPAVAEGLSAGSSVTGMPAESSASLRSAADSGDNFSIPEDDDDAELPALEDVDLDEDDPLNSLFNELEAEHAAAAEAEAEAEAEAVEQAATKARTGKAATLGVLGGNSPIPAKLPGKPGGSGASPLPSKPAGSGAKPIPKPPAGSGAKPIPKPPAGSGAKPIPKPPTGSAPKPIPKPPNTGSVPSVPRPPSTGTNPAIKAPNIPTTGTNPAIKAPTLASKPTGPRPTVTNEGEDDPFAAMLDDEEGELEEIDDIEELDAAALLEAEEFDDDDDLAASFGDIEPSPDNRSGLKSVPPPPPKKK